MHWVCDEAQVQITSAVLGSTSDPIGVSLGAVFRQRLQLIGLFSLVFSFNLGMCEWDWYL